MRKILVTGSRAHGKPQLVIDYLNEVILDKIDEEVELIHGDCPHPENYPEFQSVDKIADEVWLKRYRINALSLIDKHPAKWDVYAKKAGYVRNAEMVALKPDLVLAFPWGESKGTKMCFDLATKAGLESWWLDFKNYK